MRNHAAAPLRVLALTLALAAAAAGCDYDPGGRCETSRDCFPGQICAAGLCAAEGEPPPNQPPTAAADSYAAAPGLVLDVAAPAGLLANDADPDGDPLQAERVAPPAHGVVFVAPDGAFSYQPYSGFTGSDGFSYRASDGSLRSEVTTVTLTVGP